MKSWPSRHKQAIATLYWRWGKNFRRTFAYRFHQPGPLDDELVKRFRAEGIVRRHIDQVFAQSEAFAKVQNTMQALLGTSQVEQAMTKRSEGTGVKDFVVSVLPKRFAIDDPCVRLAIEPRLLNVVNGYLGLHAYLRAIVGWINFPTSGAPSDTQLWHQDQDDRYQVKVFLYCSDVDQATGPFCFIPRSHRAGTIDTKGWFANSSGRLSDDEMAKKIPPSQWFIGTGPAGTAVLADTTGCHKGLKPQTGPRLLVMFHYTSGAPRHPRSFHLVGEVPSDLTAAQKAALRQE